MPVYVYHCDNCGWDGEVSQHYSDFTTITLCPKCKQPMRRIWQSTSVIYKGDGWYSVDARGKSG